MDPNHKKILIKNRVALIDLDVNEEFIGNLKANGVLSRNMVEDIEVEQRRSRKAGVFLDILERRGENAFDEFYEALIKTEQGHLADILKPDMAASRKSEQLARIAGNKSALPQSNSTGRHFQSSTVQSMNGQHIHYPSEDFNVRSSIPVEDEELPSEWPPKNWDPYKEIEQMKVMGHPSDWPTKVHDRFVGNSKECYAMKGRKGRAVIINNQNFDDTSTLTNRSGSEQDAEILSKLFTKLGYDDMQKYLNNEAKQDYHNYCCSFVCAILSHGGEGNTIYGVDGDTMSVKDITLIFNNQNCEYLSGKPKIFIIQACQGNTKDTGALDRSDSSNNILESLSLDTTDGSISPLKGGCESSHGRYYVPDGEDSVDGSYPGLDRCDSVPTDSDILVANSTTEGKTSWRVGGRGSWFIQAVVYVFAKMAHNTDISKLFVKVNGLVSSATTKTNFKQASKVENTLRKDLYLYPGIGESYC
ncbi:unnamed protein product [Owenia fusiformis]|uniref:Caspase-2 n=1 Tax=Owenia fusiformis TaxID=6347 RepID=A0A8S4N0M5_OWEFU|nr:unnamed protein product [Owenia fusiformis]